jgi:hypothetical protein
MNYRQNGWILLVALVIVSLGLNVVLITQWLGFQRRIGALQGQTERALTQAIQDLDDLQTTNVEVPIKLDETVPVRTNVPLAQTFQVPISTTIPIDQDVRTTVAVDIPGLGVKVPVDVTVPIKMQIPVVLNVPVVLDSNVPISMTVPVSLDAPVRIDMQQTGLSRYLARLRASLVSLRDLLGRSGM